MYKAQNHLTISAQAIEAARFNNQFVFNSSDSNPTLIRPKAIVFIDYLEVASGSTVDIVDGDGDVVASDISSFDMTYTPLRLDHGFTVTGSVLMLRGFIIEGVFAE